MATGGSIPPDVLAERLLLAIYAYGTNTGIKAVAAGGHGHSEDDIRYVRRRYLTAEAARAIAIGIANATFAARSTELGVAAVTGVSGRRVRVAWARALARFPHRDIEHQRRCPPREVSTNSIAHGGSEHSRRRSKSGPATRSIRSPAGAGGAQGLGGGQEGGPEEHTVLDQKLSDHG